MIIPLSSRGCWSVYVLEDQAGVAFYVGMSSNVTKRAAQHATSRGAVLDRIRQIEKAGGYAQARIVAVCYSRDQALWREGVEMRQRPGLLNTMGYGVNQTRAAARLSAAFLAPIARIVAGRQVINMREKTTP